MKLKTIITSIFIILIVTFSIQNTEITDVKFLFWKLSVSRIVVITGCFFIGILVGLLISVKSKSKY
jgi:uncharacterized integral membrane protein